MRSIKLPFPGFYESSLTSALDCEEEQECDNFAEKESSPYEVETYVADEALRLSAKDFAEIFFDVTDYGVAYQQIARDYLEVFALTFKEEFGFPLDAKYEEMTSPREYNFTTDRLFALIPEEVVQKLFDLSKSEDHVRLAAKIKKECTSYDGFFSYYSNDLAVWLEKPLEDWDHNELEVMLSALLPKRFEDETLHELHDSERFFSAFQAAVDWTKFDAKVLERRQALKAGTINQGDQP